MVIIPALNEAQSIGSVVEQLRALGCLHIRVVDNGSTDATASAARAAGADVMSEPARGYGMACWRGLQELPASVVGYCSAMLTGVTISVQSRL